MKTLKTFTLIFLSSTITLLAAEEPPKPKDGNLKVGDVAPRFVLKDMSGKVTVDSNDLKGKPVVLIFGSCT